MRQSDFSRFVLALFALALIGDSALSAQVTAKQGEQDPTEFHGSMVLEAPFLPAERGHPKKEWFGSADYARLRLYRCDQIYITLFQFRVGDEKAGKVPVSVRVWLFNPEGNHDKLVELSLEVHNGDEIVAGAKRSIRVEEKDVAKREIDLPLPASGLKAEPQTQLRIVVRTRDV